MARPERQLDYLTLTDVDGLPVIYMHSGSVDPFANLLFRVGTADEAPADRGLTHLAEHRALQAFAGESLLFNGTTGLTVTSFWASGSPRKIVDFVSRLVVELARMPREADPEMLRREARILKAESSIVGPSAISAVLGDAYGAIGPGAVHMDELALYDVDAERFARWVGRFFTKGNAALVLGFPPPDHLRFDVLPDGEAQRYRGFEELLVETPVIRRRPGPLAFVAPIRRAEGSALFAIVLDRAMRARVREEDKLAYAPTVDYASVTSEWALVSGAIDAGHGDGTAVLRGFLAGVESLAEEGPSRAELDIVFEMHEELRYLSGYRVGIAVSLAEDLLYGRELKSPEDLERRIASTTPEQVRSAAASARERLVVSAPPDAEIEADWILLASERSGPGVPDGERIEPTPRQPAEDALLYLRDDAVTLVEPDEMLTVDRDSAVVVIDYKDGTRLVYGRDGRALVLVPGRWQREREVFDVAARLVDPRDRLIGGVRSAVPDGVAVPPGLAYPQRSRVTIALTALMFIAMSIGFIVEGIIGFIVLRATYAALIQPVVRRRLEGRYVFEVAFYRVQDPTWRMEHPWTRAYTFGGVLLAWLAKHRMLEPWVEEAIPGQLTALRSGAARPGDVFRDLDGILASDMCTPEASSFIAWLVSAPDLEGRQQSPIEEIYNQEIAGTSLYDHEDSADFVEAIHRNLDLFFHGRFSRLLWSRWPKLDRLAR